MSIMHNRQGYLNARGYIANLKQYLCSTLLAFGFNLEAIIFKQDNVAVHTTKIVRECVVTRCRVGHEDVCNCM